MKLIDIISTANPKKETVLEKGLTASDWINYYSPKISAVVYCFYPVIHSHFTKRIWVGAKRYYSVNLENNIPRYRGFLTQKEHGEDTSSPTVERFARVKDQDLGWGDSGFTILWGYQGRKADAAYNRNM